VDPPRARRDERPGHLSWIGSVDSLSIEITLGETHDVAAAQIDSGHQLEAIGQCRLRT